MAWRLLWFSCVLLLVVIGGVWLADNPGRVMVRWFDWRLDTNVPQLLVLMLSVAALFYAFMRTWRFFCNIPQSIRGFFTRRRHRKGVEALQDGLAGIAAGNQQEVSRAARRVDSLLGNENISLMLATQAAELAGDNETAKANYHTMLEQSENEMSAVRGLLMLALQEKDDENALLYAERAEILNSKTVWLGPVLLDLYMRVGQWEKAMKYLLKLNKQGRFSEQEYARKRALILVGQAADQEKNSPDSAVRLARQAHEADLGYFPALERYVRLAVETKRHVKALPSVLDAWAMQPTTQTANLVAQLLANRPLLDQVSQAEELVRRCPDAASGHILLGRLAMQARLWAKARQHLELAVNIQADPDVYILLSCLEGVEGNTSGAGMWLDKATHAAVPLGA